MLSHHLEGALSDLRDLVEITKADITDIKEANNNPQFDRLSIKEDKLKSFEQKKAMIDHEISSLMTENPDAELSELLDNQQHQSLEQLKVELNNLRIINREYSKLVLAVSTLYNTFLERLVPMEMDGYEKRATKNPSVLEVRV